MSDLSNIVKKELREMFTIATIGATVLIIIMFSVIGQAQAGVMEEAKKKPVIGVINEDNGSLSEIVVGVLNVQAEVVYSSSSISDVTEGLQEVEANGGSALLVISQDFSENIYENRPGEIRIHWIVRGLGITDAVPSQVISMLIQIAEENISKMLVAEGSSVNPDLVLNPIKTSETTIFRGREMENVPPGSLTGILSSQSYIVSFIVMMVIATGGGTVIASMGMEKENKTLETLLTLPVKRDHILFGKILAGVIYGFVMAAIYMLGLAYYMQSFQTSVSGLNLASLGLTLNLYDYILIGTSIFVTLLAGFSLCMVLGVFAKSYKTAQNFLFPVMILAMIPMFLSMFMDFNTLPLALKIAMFAIPFSHPMMAVRALMFDDYLLVLSGIAYVAIFAAVIIAIGVWIFKSDRLLTAGVGAGKWRARFLRGFFGRRGG
jgi:ABC-2 type transport system permease protein